MRLSTRNLKISRENNGETIVSCFDTVILAFSEQKIMLSHGDHKTRSTLRRINECLDVFRLPWKVKETKAGLWQIIRVAGPNACIDFPQTGSIEIRRNIQPWGPKNKSEGGFQ